MESLFRIDYTFEFESGKKIEIPVRLEEDTLESVESADIIELEWGALENKQCDGCPLDPKLSPFCPVACNLATVIEKFKEFNSIDRAKITVIVKERSYFKETDLQEGLGSLLGILMATSGCPYLAPLKPMVRFHLPFASIKETEFRMVSMYLVAQYILQKNGKNGNWDLSGLKEIYSKVAIVNQAIAARLRDAYNKDASINAVVILDCFAKSVTYAIKTMMNEYEKYFASYINKADCLQQQSGSTCNTLEAPSVVCP